MSLRMGSNQGAARTSVLDKRVPRNPRYASVKSKASLRTKYISMLPGIRGALECVMRAPHTLGYRVT